MTKTIGLSDDAYRRFVALKRPGESFSDVVRRMTSAAALLRLAGTMDRKTGRHYMKAIREGRRREREETVRRTRRMMRRWR